MMKSKIHKATVTETNIQYEGSLTLDSNLLEAADILPGEKIQVVNLNNGSRLETYAIIGPAGSGVVCLNGAAARHAEPGDVVLIIAYALVPNEEAASLRPRVVFLNANNQVTPPLRKQSAFEAPHR